MVGVFDSGLGGLTVLKELLNVLPEHDYIYLGDTARTPYGGRSEETIYRYCREAVDFLFEHDCKLIIFACNTASAQALRGIQREYLPKKYPGRNVLGVIRPLVEKAGLQKNIRRIGVIGTRATIRSKAYEIELKKINPNLEIFQSASPLLVPLIEEGWTGKAETKKILRKYLQWLKIKQVEILIPACTHYPILLKEIKKIMGKRCLVLNGGQIVAESLQSYLLRHPEYSGPGRGKVKYFTSDDPGRFSELAERFLGFPISGVEKARYG